MIQKLYSFNLKIAVFAALEIKREKQGLLLEFQFYGIGKFYFQFILV